MNKLIGSEEGESDLQGSKVQERNLKRANIKT